MSTSPRHPQTPTGVTTRTLSYSPDERQRPHHHDLTSLTLVYGGSLEELVGSRQEAASALSVVYKPAGTEHANRIGPSGATTFQLEFAEGYLGDVRPEDWEWSHGGEAARRFLELVRGLQDGEDSVFDCEARLFDVLAALSSNRSGLTAGPRQAPRWLSHAVDEIEDTYRRPRSVREIAADANIHPVALARAHRRHFGSSITDRIRGLRVREAAGRLVGGDPISTVAFATGFSDQAHMTRVFRRETGLTPGAYRDLLG